jgi:hypothetical protein
VVDEHGVTIHRPIDAEPLRYRPDGTDADRAYYGPRDPLDEQRIVDGRYEPVDTWRTRTNARAEALMREALHGVETTPREDRILRWLSDWERVTVVVIASLLDRTYRAGLAAGRAEGIAAERARRRKVAARKPRRTPGDKID